VEPSEILDCVVKDDTSAPQRLGDDLKLVQHPIGAPQVADKIEQRLEQLVELKEDGRGRRLGGGANDGLGNGGRVCAGGRGILSGSHVTPLDAH
jgi:hypothetical protein